MKKVFIRGLILTLAAALSTPALAAKAGTGYLDFGLGLGRLGSPSYFGLRGVAFPNPMVLGFGAGYNVTPNLAVEGGYSIFGDSTINDSGIVFVPGIGNVSATSAETLSTSSLHFAAVGMVPLSEQVDLFGKLGLAHNSMSYSCSGTANGLAFSCSNINASANNLMYGLGVKFSTSQHFGIRLQYENYGSVDMQFGLITKSFTLANLSAEGVYTF